MVSITAKDLGLKEVPETRPTVVGAPLSFTLRGVVGATAVMVRIVNAFDARLSEAHCAEESLRKRWEEEWGLQAGP